MRKNKKKWTALGMMLVMLTACAGEAAPNAEGTPTEAVGHEKDAQENINQGGETVENQEENLAENTDEAVTAPEVIYQTSLSVSAEPIKSIGETIDMEKIKTNILFKAVSGCNNPLLTNLFCADPTSIEYEGRLYVYGTNDNQQYLEKGTSDNTYEKIKSFVIMSTEDMVNWRFEGYINTGEIAPWIIASWAPSIVSRVEEDGLTHFYLYFSNSGWGTGVLTATHPAGPWTDPLGKSLVDGNTPNLNGCQTPFDPGVCIDENGVGWLSFGGSGARIVRLGADMISLDSEITEIPAPYHFEANELNYINGTYVYTYNNSWATRTEWDSEAYGTTAPPSCSMSYMTTKTPLDTDSWVYQDYYLRNPGELNMEYSNNHTHLHEYKGQYYLFYHTLLLQRFREIKFGFRSIGVDVVEVDEENVKISKCRAAIQGVDQIEAFSPYRVNQAEEVNLTNADYKQETDKIAAVCKEGQLSCIKGVDFKAGSSTLGVKVKGKGAILVRLDGANNETIATLSFDCEDWTAVYDAVEIEGTHDLFFVFAGEFEFDEWEFVEKK